MRTNLTGFASATTRDLILTCDQFDGTGITRHKALAIPNHLNGWIGGPWANIEFVSLDPIRDRVQSSIGLHEQTTDELFYFIEGTGTLTTNGTREHVCAGCLVLAPRGTIHALVNDSYSEPLSFLAVELRAQHELFMPAMVINLFERLKYTESLLAVRVGQQQVSCWGTTLDLRGCFGRLSAWQYFTLVRLPAGGRVVEYANEQADQLLLLRGLTTVGVGVPDNTREVRIDTNPEDYHSIVIPRGAICRIENRANGNTPATLVRLTVCRDQRADYESERAGNDSTSST